ncbi:carbohydrate ABC transporter permease [Amycolatopsis sp. GM8]|uniref:carbohydrate ABC transporter permease n=1 Tax=Amycolatopsis sp. GM8 TaxID=2896530 RepID=UPI001F3193B6|nr:sugar ABC transporter permease [Amycolatopsis sp. GM8]
MSHALATGAASTRRRRIARFSAPYLFVAVPLVYMTVVVFYPAAREVWLSFTNTKLSRPNGGHFVGTDNYARIFGSDLLWTSLLTTVLYVLGVVAGCLVLGTLAALAVDRPFRGRALVRGVLAFGWAVPGVATALAWSWIFNSQTGVLNRITGALGLGTHDWLSNQELALPSVIAATVWQYTPFVMLVVLAALQSVPPEVREASHVDGADALSRFRAVTLPHILPAIRLVALLLVVWSMRLFEIIYLLTGGGPLNRTSTLVVSLELQAFENYDLGGAATYGVVGLVISLAVTVVYFVVERRSTHGV